MRLCALFLIFGLITCASGNIPDAEVEEITQLLVNYTGVDTTPFRSEVKRCWKVRNVGLEELARVLILFEKRGADDFLRGPFGKISSATATFSLLTYSRLANKMALLDFLFGTEKANEWMRKNHESIRNNYAITGGLQTFAGGAPDNSTLRDIVEEAERLVGQDPRVNVDVEFPKLFMRHGVVPRERKRLTRFSFIVEASSEEAATFLAKYLTNYVPSASAVSLQDTDEPKLVQMLIGGSPSIQALAAEELGRRPELQWDTLVAVLDALEAGNRIPEITAPLSRALRRTLTFQIGNALQEGPLTNDLVSCVRNILIQLRDLTEKK